MSKPVKGDEAVDETALNQSREACLYIEEYANQLSKETLNEILATVERATARLNAALNWRVKQSIGGEYIARLKRQLKQQAERIALIENRLGIKAVEELETDEEVNPERTETDDSDRVAPQSETLDASIPEGSQEQDEASSEDKYVREMV